AGGGTQPGNLPGKSPCNHREIWREGRAAARRVGRADQARRSHPPVSGSVAVVLERQSRICESDWRRIVMRTEITLSAVLIALLAAGCTKVHDVVERPTPVEVQTVQAFSGKDVKRFSAVLQPYEQVDLSFRVGGYVDRVAQTKGVEHRMRPIQDGDH